MNKSSHFNFSVRIPLGNMSQISTLEMYRMATGNLGTFQHTSKLLSAGGVRPPAPPLTVGLRPPQMSAFGLPKFVFFFESIREVLRLSEWSSKHFELCWGIHSTIPRKCWNGFQKKFRGKRLYFFLESIPKFPGNIYTDSPKSVLNLLGNLLEVS